MPLYVLNALDAGEREALRAHIAGGCPACAGALAEAQTVVAHLALIPAPLAAPAAAREQLVQRVAADARRRTPATDVPTSDSLSAPPAVRIPRRARLARLALAACLGAAAGAAAIWLPLHEQARLTTEKDLQFVLLKGSDPQPAARGRIFWDTARNDWHVYVFDMKPPAPGRTYELWFITPEQKKVPAGTFEVDRSGRGSLVVSLPPGLGPVAVAAITDEPRGGAPQPTGKIQLLGKIE